MVLVHKVNQAHQDHLEEMELDMIQLISASTLLNTYRVSCVFIKIGLSAVTNEKKLKTEMC